jgi:putative FmdB family regulatory protein
MPLYEYECKCGMLFEEIAAIGDKQKKCPDCGQMADKIPSAFSFKHGKTREQLRRNDDNKEYKDVCENLKLKHDVHEFKPLPNSEGRDFRQVYKDVQKLGSKVKEDMAMSRAVNQVRTKEKQKKWMEGALKRTKAKEAIIRERRKQEAAQAKSR